MKLNRRAFMKIAGATGAVAGVAGIGSARENGEDEGALERAMLVDTTLCVGCRACEAACSEANGLPAPADGEQVLEQRRDTGPDAFTVVNRIGTGKDGSERFAKRQCMHCVEPACASACPVRALDKTAEGPVIYRGDRCMGCRYCMVACPFRIPKYQYDKVAPLVRKCTFCAERQAKGLAPACASVCPTGALTFGIRRDLLELAKRKIWGAPDKYLHHVYGEHEAGGTDWLYITDQSVEALALTDVELSSYPEKVRGALGAPPFVMTLWPPLLMGLYAFTHRDREKGNGEAGPDGEEERP